MSVAQRPYISFNKTLKKLKRFFFQIFLFCSVCVNGKHGSVDVHEPNFLIFQQIGQLASVKRQTVVPLISLQEEEKKKKHNMFPFSSQERTIITHAWVDFRACLISNPAMNFYLFF